MATLSRELIFLILQFLDEEKYREALHKLEKESGVYFNMKHFEEAVLAGDWEEVENYLLGYTKLEDNRYSMKIFFEIRKQKYLEALDRRDRAKAVEILMKDLKVFKTFNQELFKEITLLLTLDNFRENEQLAKYGDTKSARTVMLTELKKLIEANPVFRDKLQFPAVRTARLRALINQSLNWQHQLCPNPKANPDIKSLFFDHSCNSSNGVCMPSAAPGIPNFVSKPGLGFQPLGPNAVFQPPAPPLPTSLTSWMPNPSSLPHPSMPGSHLGLTSTMHLQVAPPLKRPFSPAAGMPSVDYHAGDPEHALKRRAVVTPEEVGMPNIRLRHGYTNNAQNLRPPDDLPKTLAGTLIQGSSVTSMDFHPAQPILLLVGTNVGDIAIWQIASRERIAFRNFRVWDLKACSATLQTTLFNDPAVAVNRVIWNHDGSHFGVAYSKHIVHIYKLSSRDDLVQHLEIEAHVGGVNDLGYARPNDKECVVTCGDDKTIKVWDAGTGAIQFTFEGHETPVYSIYPHNKEAIQFIFSISVDGKIKAHLYENGSSKVDYDAPGRCRTTMAYTADGKRLFSCGTSKDGETYIVEWNESEGTIKRQYSGLRKRATGVVQFDTSESRFIAAGDDFMIKFWDMDEPNLLAYTDAEGGLAASPRIRFNTAGSLLAVSTNDNCIKILANSFGLRLLHAPENRSSNASKLPIETLTNAMPMGSMTSTSVSTVAVIDQSAPLTAADTTNGEQKIIEIKPRAVDDPTEKLKKRIIEINEPCQCCSLRLPDNLQAGKVCRLTYTNSGYGILALAYNAVHKLWRWHKNDQNTSGKATASIAPQLWQPSSGILMINEINDRNLGEEIHCFALSKNDSYLMSASGGKVSLFNMTNFRKMTIFMHPQPAATFIAFNPQDNNVLAIGMDDSSIQIYNVRTDEVKCSLRGHQKRVTGLAFCSTNNVLVSSGADAQLCVWETERWEKCASKFLQISTGPLSGSLSETRIQFHHNQIYLLVVHERLLAIYDVQKMDCLEQWRPQSLLITHATYSCDSKMIYTSFTDGSLCILDECLGFKCRINPAAYLPSQLSQNVHPVVVAAHPSEPSQFAVGLSDGGVYIFEPLESEGKWGGEQPPQENGAGPSTNTTQVATNISNQQL